MATAEREQRAFIRQDGKDKVTGLGRYTADLTFTGMLHARFRYSDHAHARILRVDTTAARALRGVFAVITAEDVPDVRYGPYVQDRSLFARDVVRFEGEVVAGVAALTPEIAEQAAALIEVDYERLPVIVDPEESLVEGAPLIHDGWAGYGALEDMVRDGNDASRSTIVKGDVEAGLGESDVVLRERYVADMSHAAPIEPRAVVAQWNGDKVTIWSSTQVPFNARAGVATTLEMPESDVRIIVPHLGGGFGGKCEFHFEAHVAALARAARRPVRLVFTRREEFVAPDHRREGQVIEFETGARADGTLIARRARLVLDNGAYSADASFFSQLAAMMAVGPYRIPHVSVDASLAYTNTSPSGSVRAPSAPQACWAVEQHMDELAARLAIDPVELRRRNIVREGDEGPTRQVFKAIGAAETLEQAVQAIGYGRELPEDEAIGVACGYWPSFANPSGAHVKLHGDGSGTIVTGAQECGTGAVMALPLLAAEVLGMRPEQFTVVYQDTDAGPWDAGASGSQTTTNNGRAVMEAARDVREQLLDLAEEQLEAARADLEIADGEVRVKGSPTSSVSIEDLAAQAAGDRLLIGRGSGPLPPTPEVDASGCTGRLGMESWVGPTFITHAVRCKVDRRTGVVRVLEVAAAHDSGRVLNPRGATGQVEGGVVMGIGMALTEGTQIGDDGRQRNPHLLDYKLQTASDCPPIDVRWVEVPDDEAGPNGSKGVAEPPCVPTPGAIGNAIAKVLGRRVYRLPMTPARVWEASQK
ncbi:MAG TPA: xanthine dehydrogenase family protein molybdopterin-binding subunit [Gaiellales bacterium]|nr:xanthine dehydrogenase family protein molybdopterin-binding subunit [Gaiellales bacterium]